MWFERKIGKKIDEFIYENNKLKIIGISEKEAFKYVVTKNWQKCDKEEKREVKTGFLYL